MITPSLRLSYSYSVVNQSLMAHEFYLLIIVAAVSRHFCVTLTLAQNSCSPINVSNETAGSPPMNVRNHEFYLDINNPASCSGRIVSWKVCYHGPANPGRKQYEIVYAIYQRTANSSGDVTYNKVSDTFSTTLRRGGSTKFRTYTPLYAGFHCYEALDNDNLPINITAGDIIGACVKNQKNHMHQQLNIIDAFNSSEHSLFHMIMNKPNECRANGNKIPSKISSSERSETHLNSSRLHLYVDISK